MANANQLKFDVRLDSKEGKDIHREFKGTYWTNDGSIAIAEVKTTASKVVITVVIKRGIHPKPDNSRAYGLEDIYVGSKFSLTNAESGQVWNFIVTKVEGESESFATQELLSSDAPSDRRILEIQEKMRQKIRERGATTIQGLGRHFKIVDDSGDRAVDEREFSKAIREYGFNITDEEVRLLMQAYDRNKDGTIDYEEFLRGVRGAMNEFRKSLVHKAFKKLDANKNGVIQLDDIKLFYNAKLNPQVVSGEKTEDEVLLEFLNGFDSIEKDGTVTYEEFEEYYNGVSVSIDSDEYFALMMYNVWKVEA